MRNYYFLKGYIYIYIYSKNIHTIYIQNIISELIPSVWLFILTAFVYLNIVSKQKLKLLKKKLKTLRTQYSHSIVAEAEEDKKALKQAQIQLQSSPTSAAHQQTEAQAYPKFRQTSYLAKIYLQQRSKATWIKLGDDNTKYFYSVIRHKKLKQTTTQLKNLNRRLTYRSWNYCRSICQLL